MSMKTDKALVKRNESGYVVAEARGFKIIMDTPEASGGTNKGMTPVELMLCSLGACQVLTATILAAHYRMNIDDISVELEGDLNRDGFSGSDPNARSGFQKLRYHFYINSTESEERLKMLMEMVQKRCPVSDSLNKGVDFEEAVYTLTNNLEELKK